MGCKRFLATCILLLLSVSHAAWADDIDDGDTALHKGNYETALKLLMPYAEKGNAIAELDIGILYFSGNAVPQDRVEAAKWFKLAAEQGSSGAQTDLGIIYATGNGGPKDLLQAYMWFSVAAQNKQKNTSYAEKYRDHVASELAPDDLKRAQAMTDQCLAAKYKNCGAAQ
jgi:TPR repeat protein